jgi:hypothetical protein
VNRQVIHNEPAGKGCMNLLNPGNFPPCDAGNETISKKSYAGKDITYFVTGTLCP